VRAPERIKGTHQRLIVIEHKEKVHQRPIFACLRRREAGLGLRSAFGGAGRLRRELRLLTGSKWVCNKLGGRCRRWRLLR
jgi:hypothetical protein